MDDRYDTNAYFDVKQLQLLDVLHATRSVTRTAERLGQTQPTVSAWLKQLRDKADDPLFIRTSKEMVPTPRAELLVEKAREILEAMRQISSALPCFDPAASSRVFRICAPDSAHITMVPRLLQCIRGIAPDVQVETLPVNDNSARLLENGDADLAYGGFIPGVDTGFYQQALFRQDFICLASMKHPRVQGQIALEDYQREAHVAVSYGGIHGVNALIKSALHAKRIQRRVLLALTGFLGIGKVVATTDLITTLPRNIGETLASQYSLQILECPVGIPTYMIKQYW
ncbi:MAG: LysR family transcriptional regulator, partial [Candidatus Accumulibacter sp.]|nr:LysR family transcriptional regulator [Accumulibacter sp.]